MKFCNSIEKVLVDVLEEYLSVEDKDNIVNNKAIKTIFIVRFGCLKLKTSNFSDFNEVFEFKESLVNSILDFNMQMIKDDSNIMKELFVLAANVCANLECYYEDEFNERVEQLRIDKQCYGNFDNLPEI